MYSYNTSGYFKVWSLWHHICLFWHNLHIFKLSTSVTDTVSRGCSTVTFVISRTGQSQGLLYKQPCPWFSHWLSQPFPPTALRRRHAKTIRNSTSSYKIDFVIMIKKFLDPKGYQNLFSGSKLTAILLKGWIRHIGGVASERVCACSLHSRLVFWRQRN